MQQPPGSNYYRQPQQPQQYQPYPPGPPEPSLDSISVAWNVLKSDFGTFIVAFLLAGAIGYAINLPASFFGNYMVYGSAIHIGPPDLAKTFRVEMWVLPIAIISNAVVYPMYVGIMHVTLKKLEGQLASVSDLFFAYRSFRSLLVASILTSIVLWIGFVLLIVPGIYLAGALAFTPLLIIRQNLGPVEAMQKSMQILSGGRAFAIFGVLFCAGVLSALGVCACGVGILFTAPLLYITRAVIYYNYFPPQIQAPSYDVPPQQPGPAGPYLRPPPE